VITIERFIDAYRSHREGRHPLRLLQDQAAVLIAICRTTYRPITDALEVTDADIHWLLKQPEATQDYANLLGGNVCICEMPEDLTQVVGCDFEFAEQHGRWPNVTDIPLSFDQCSYVQEQSGEPTYVLFLTIWSDSGGPVYYVPKHLWNTARVDEHMAATNTVWRGNAS
jgi:hypothetical protein